MDFLGSAAFSKAVQALDVKTGMLVCLKIIKVCLPRAQNAGLTSKVPDNEGCQASYLDDMHICST